MTPHQCKLRAWVIALAGAVAIYALAGFFLVPPLARQQVVRRGSAALKHAVAVDAVYFNPFTFHARFDNIRVERKGESPLATVAFASLNFNPIASLVHRRWQFGLIRMASPQVRLAVDDEGRLNVSELLTPSDERGGPPPIAMERLIVEDGTIFYRDRARAEPFATTVTPVSFTLADFSTEPDEFGNYRLTGTTAAGRSFTWRGRIAVAPFHSSGRVAFEHIDLPTFSPFFAAFLAADVVSGSLAFDGNYEVSLGRTRRAAVSDFTIQATNLVLVMPEAESPVIELPSATIEVQEAELFDRSVRIAQVTLEGWTVRVERESDGTINLPRLLARVPTAAGEVSGDAAPNNGIVLRIESLELRNGTVQYRDHSLAEPFALTVSPVELTLNEFSTESDRPGGRYRLAGRTDSGGGFVSSGTIAVAPWASRGTLELDQLGLGVYTPFFARMLHGEVRSGTVTLAASYDLSLGADRHATVSDATWRITDLVLAKTDSEQPVIEVPLFSGDLQQASVFEPSAQITRMVLDGVVMRLERAPDGTFNVAGLFGRPSPSEDNSAVPDGNEDASAEVAKDASGRDALYIANINFTNGTIVYKDQAGAGVKTFQAENIQLAAGGLSSDFARDVEIDLSLQWAGGRPGVIKAAGTVRPRPWQAELNVSGVDLELPPITPYVESIAAVRLVSGRATFDGKLEGSQSRAGPPAFHWTGRAAIDDVDLRDARLGHELAQWRHLGVNESELTTQPLTFTAREVSIREPVLHVRRTQDGTMNWATLVTTADDDPARENADEPRPENASPLQTRIDLLVVSDGGITFRDRSIEPEFATAITQLEGALLGLSSAPGVAAQIELTGILAGTAPVVVRGEIDLLSEDTLSNSEVRIELTNLPIDSFQGYAKRYLGYELEQGKMRGDLVYATEQGRLHGTNRIVVENLLLGESVESPDAISVPLKLALAVLRNRQDEVVFNVEVSGSLESPEFSFGQIVQRAFRNVLVKAATSPFSLLGSLFGFEEEDLRAAEFLPGEALIRQAAEKRLDALAQVLNDRPGLAVVINWRPMEAVDKDTLKEKHLRQLMQQEREALAGAGSDRKADDVTEEEAMRSLVRRRVPEAVAPIAGGREEDGRGELRKDRSPWFVRLFVSIFGRGDTAEPAADEAAGVQGERADLRQQLLESLTLSTEDYRELARARAIAAREYLIAAGIDPHRVEMGEASIQADQPETIPSDQPNRALVFFELTESPARPAAASP